MAKALFFFADGTLGEEPYLTNSDGSDADRLADIAPGSFDSVDDDFVAVVGNKVLFAADNFGATNDSGTELWSYDADTGVTSLLKDIEFGPNDSDPDFLVSAGNFAFFQAFTTDFGQELWVSDGTSAGTKRLTDIDPNNGNGLNNNLIAKFGDKALFIGDDGVSGFEDLWISGGDEFSTNQLVGTALNANFFDIMFDPIVERYGALDSSSFYFQAESIFLGRELWKTDGTSAGTVEIKDINVGGDSNPEEFMALNGRMYFTADNGFDGRELWRSDGTAGGTQIVKDINVAGAGFDSDPKDFKLLKTPTGDKLIFSADDGVNGRELWITDGTNAGTTLVLNINGNNSDSLEFADFNEDTYFAVVGDGSKAVFSANDGNVQEELWITDGTTGGTMLLKEIDIDDGNDSDPEDFFEGGNGLAYFSADVDGEVPGQVPTGRELWVTDGTEDGTKLVKNIQNGDNNSNPFPRANVEVNSPPSSPTLSSSSVAENADEGGTIGTLASTDGDGDTVTYSITSDTDQKFAIEGSNLTLKEGLDFEDKSSHSVTVEASDGKGGSSSSTFTVNVTDVNEAPENLALDASSVSEGSAVGTVVGKLSASDPDASDNDDDIIYSLTDDAENRFAIQGSNVVVNGDLDFEADPTQSVTVEAADGNGGTTSATFTINVTDVNESPSDPTLSSSSVAENTSTGSTVGTLSSTDPDGDSVTYELINDAGGLFAIAGDKLVVDGDLDFENEDSHTISVRASDGNGGTSSTRTFSIEVTDVDESNQATEGPDIFKGTGIADIFDGLGGADVIRGKGGADILSGGKGADKVIGGGGNDEVNGNNGADRLKGNAGADTIDGGKGRDKMTGGGDTDTFEFIGEVKNNGSIAKTGKDTITDFKIGIDMLDYSGEGLVFDDLTIRKNGGDAKIVTDKGEFVILEDIAKSDVTSEIFDFV